MYTTNQVNTSHTIIIPSRISWPRETRVYLGVMKGFSGHYCSNTDKDQLIHWMLLKVVQLYKVQDVVPIMPPATVSYCVLYQYA